MQEQKHGDEAALWIVSLVVVIGLALLYDSVIPGPRWIVVLAWVLSTVILAVVAEMYAKRTGRKGILHKILSWMEIF